MQSPARIALNKMYPASIYAAPAIAPLVVGVNYATGLAQKQNQAMFNYTLQQMAMSPFSVNSEAYMERIRSAFGYANNGMYETMGVIGGVVGAGVGAYLGAGGWRGFDETLGWNPLKWKERWNNPFQSPFIRNADGIITPRPTKREMTSRIFRPDTDLNNFINNNKTIIDNYNTNIKVYNKFVDEHQDIFEQLSKVNSVEEAKKLNISEGVYNTYSDITKKLNSSTSDIYKAAKDLPGQSIKYLDETINATKTISKVGSTAMGIAGTAVDIASATGNIVGAVQAFQDADVLQGILYTSGALGDIGSVVGDVLSLIGNAVPILKIIGEAVNWVGFAQSALSGALIGWLSGQTVGHSLSPEGAKAQQLYAQNLHASTIQRPITTLATLLTMFGAPLALNALGSIQKYDTDSLFKKGLKTTLTPLIWTGKQSNTAIGNYVRSFTTMQAVQGIQTLTSKAEDVLFGVPENPEDVNFTSVFSLVGDLNDNLYGATARKSMLIGLGKSDASAQTKALARAWGYSNDDTYYSPTFDDVRQAFNLELGNAGNSLFSTIGEILIDPQNLSEIALARNTKNTTDSISKTLAAHLNIAKIRKLSGQDIDPMLSKLLFAQDVDGNLYKRVYTDGTNYSTTATKGYDPITIIKKDNEYYTYKDNNLTEINITDDIYKDAMFIPTVLNVSTKIELEQKLKHLLRTYIESGKQGLADFEIQNKTYIKGSTRTFEITDTHTNREFVENLSTFFDKLLKDTYTPQALSTVEQEQIIKNVQELYTYYNTKGEDTTLLINKLIIDLNLINNNSAIKKLYASHKGFKQQMDLIEQTASMFNKLGNPVGWLVNSGLKNIIDLFTRSHAVIDIKHRARLIESFNNVKERANKLSVNRINEINKSISERYSINYKEIEDQIKNDLSDNPAIKRIQQESDSYKAVIEELKQQQKQQEEYTKQNALKQYELRDNQTVYVVINEENKNDIKKEIEALQNNPRKTKEEKLKLKYYREAYIMYEYNEAFFGYLNTLCSTLSTALICFDQFTLSANTYLISLLNRIHKLPTLQSIEEYTEIKEILKSCGMNIPNISKIKPTTFSNLTVTRDIELSEVLISIINDCISQRFGTDTLKEIQVLSNMHIEKLFQYSPNKWNNLTQNEKENAIKSALFMCANSSNQPQFYEALYEDAIIKSIITRIDINTAKGGTLKETIPLSEVTLPFLYKKAFSNFLKENKEQFEEVLMMFNDIEDIMNSAKDFDEIEQGYAEAYVKTFTDAVYNVPMYKFIQSAMNEKPIKNKLALFVSNELYKALPDIDQDKLDKITYNETIQYQKQIADSMIIKQVEQMYDTYEYMTLNNKVISQEATEDEKKQYASINETYTIEKEKRENARTNNKYNIDNLRDNISAEIPEVKNTRKKILNIKLQTQVDYLEALKLLYNKNFDIYTDGIVIEISPIVVSYRGVDTPYTKLMRTKPEGYNSIIRTVATDLVHLKETGKINAILSGNKKIETVKEIETAYKAGTLKVIYNTTNVNKYYALCVHKQIYNILSKDYTNPKAKFKEMIDSKNPKLESIYKDACEQVNNILLHDKGLYINSIRKDANLLYNFEQQTIKSAQTYTAVVATDAAKKILSDVEVLKTFVKDLTELRTDNSTYGTTLGTMISFLNEYIYEASSSTRFLKHKQFTEVYTIDNDVYFKYNGKELSLLQVLFEFRVDILDIERIVRNATKNMNPKDQTKYIELVRSRFLYYTETLTSLLGKSLSKMSKQDYILMLKDTTKEAEASEAYDIIMNSWKENELISLFQFSPNQRRLNGSIYTPQNFKRFYNEDIYKLYTTAYDEYLNEKPIIYNNEKLSVHGIEKNTIPDFNTYFLFKILTSNLPNKKDILEHVYYYDLKEAHGLYGAESLNNHRKRLDNLRSYITTIPADAVELRQYVNVQIQATEYAIQEFEKYLNTKQNYKEIFISKLLNNEVTGEDIIKGLYVHTKISDADKYLPAFTDDGELVIVYKGTEQYASKGAGSLNTLIIAKYKQELEKDLYSTVNIQSNTYKAIKKPHSSNLLIIVPDNTKDLSNLKQYENYKHINVLTETQCKEIKEMMNNNQIFSYHTYKAWVQDNIVRGQVNNHLNVKSEQVLIPKYLDDLRELDTYIKQGGTFNNLYKYINVYELPKPFIGYSTGTNLFQTETFKNIEQSAITTNAWNTFVEYFRSNTGKFLCNLDTIAEYFNNDIIYNDNINKKDLRWIELENTTFTNKEGNTITYADAVLDAIQSMKEFTNVNFDYSKVYSSEFVNGVNNLSNIIVDLLKDTSKKSKALTKLSNIYKKYKNNRIQDINAKAAIATQNISKYVYSKWKNSFKIHDAEIMQMFVNNEDVRKNEIDTVKTGRINYATLRNIITKLTELQNKWDEQQFDSLCKTLGININKITHNKQLIFNELICPFVQNISLDCIRSSDTVLHENMLNEKELTGITAEEQKMFNDLHKCINVTQIRACVNKLMHLFKKYNYSTKDIEAFNKQIITDNMPQSYVVPVIAYLEDEFLKNIYERGYNKDLFSNKTRAVKIDKSHYIKYQYRTPVKFVRDREHIYLGDKSKYNIPLEDYVAHKLNTKDVTVKNEIRSVLHSIERTISTTTPIDKNSNLLDVRSVHELCVVMKNEFVQNNNAFADEDTLIAIMEQAFRTYNSINKAAVSDGIWQQMDSKLRSMLAPYTTNVVALINKLFMVCSKDIYRNTFYDIINNKPQKTTYTLSERIHYINNDIYTNDTEFYNYIKDKIKVPRAVQVPFKNASTLQEFYDTVKMYYKVNEYTFTEFMLYINHLKDEYKNKTQTYEKDGKTIPYSWEVAIPKLYDTDAILRAKSVVITDSITGYDTPSIVNDVKYTLRDMNNTLKFIRSMNTELSQIIVEHPKYIEKNLSPINIMYQENKINIAIKQIQHYTYAPIFSNIKNDSLDLEAQKDIHKLVTDSYSDMLEEFNATTLEDIRSNSKTYNDLRRLFTDVYVKLKTNTNKTFVRMTDIATALKAINTRTEDAEYYLQQYELIRTEDLNNDINKIVSYFNNKDYLVNVNVEQVKAILGYIVTHENKDVDAKEILKLQEQLWRNNFSIKHDRLERVTYKAYTILNSDMNVESKINELTKIMDGPNATESSREYVETCIELLNSESKLNVSLLYDTYDVARSSTKDIVYKNYKELSSIIKHKLQVIDTLESDIDTTIKGMNISKAKTKSIGINNKQTFTNSKGKEYTYYTIHKDDIDDARNYYNTKINNLHDELKAENNKTENNKTIQRIRVNHYILSLLQQPEISSICKRIINDKYIPILTEAQQELASITKTITYYPDIQLQLDKHLNIYAYKNTQEYIILNKYLRSYKDINDALNDAELLKVLPFEDSYRAITNYYTQIEMMNKSSFKDIISTYMTKHPKSNRAKLIERCTNYANAYNKVQDIQNHIQYEREILTRTDINDSEWVTVYELYNNMLKQIDRIPKSNTTYSKTQIHSDLVNKADTYKNNIMYYINRWMSNKHTQNLTTPIKRFSRTIDKKMHKVITQLETYLNIDETHKMYPKLLQQFNVTTFKDLHDTIKNYLKDTKYIYEHIKDNNINYTNVLELIDINRGVPALKNESQMYNKQINADYDLNKNTIHNNKEVVLIGTDSDEVIKLKNEIQTQEKELEKINNYVKRQESVEQQLTEYKEHTEKYNDSISLYNNTKEQYINKKGNLSNSNLYRTYANITDDDIAKHIIERAYNDKLITTKEIPNAELHNPLVDILLTAYNFMYMQGAITDNKIDINKLPERFIVFDMETVKDINGEHNPYDIAVIQIVNTPEGLKSTTACVSYNNPVFFEGTYEQPGRLLQQFIDTQRDIMKKENPDVTEDEVKEKVMYIINNHKYVKNDIEQTKALINILNNAQCPIIAHNGIKFDFKNWDSFVKTFASRIIYREVTNKLYENPEKILNNLGMNTELDAESISKEFKDAIAHLVKNVTPTQEAVDKVNDLIHKYIDTQMETIIKNTYAKVAKELGHITNDKPDLSSFEDLQKYCFEYIYNNADTTEAEKLLPNAKELFEQVKQCLTQYSTGESKHVYNITEYRKVINNILQHLGIDKKEWYQYDYSERIQTIQNRINSYKELINIIQTNPNKLEDYDNLLKEQTKIIKDTEEQVKLYENEIHIIEDEIKKVSDEKQTILHSIRNIYNQIKDAFNDSRVRANSLVRLCKENLNAVNSNVSDLQYTLDLMQAQLKQAEYTLKVVFEIIKGNKVDLDEILDNVVLTIKNPNDIQNAIRQLRQQEQEYTTLKTQVNDNNTWKHLYDKIQAEAKITVENNINMLKDLTSKTLLNIDFSKEYSGIYEQIKEQLIKHPEWKENKYIQKIIDIISKDNEYALSTEILKTPYEESKTIGIKQLNNKWIDSKLTQINKTLSVLSSVADSDINRTTINNIETYISNTMSNIKNLENQRDYILAQAVEKSMFRNKHTSVCYDETHKDEFEKEFISYNSKVVRDDLEDLKEFGVKVRFNNATEGNDILGYDLDPDRIWFSESDMGLDVYSYDAEHRQLQSLHIPKIDKKYETNKNKWTYTFTYNYTQKGKTLQKPSTHVYTCKASDITNMDESYKTIFKNNIQPISNELISFDEGIDYSKHSIDKLVEFTLKNNIDNIKKNAIELSNVPLHYLIKVNCSDIVRKKFVKRLPFISALQKEEFKVHDIQALYVDTYKKSMGNLNAITPGQYLSLIPDKVGFNFRFNFTEEGLIKFNADPLRVTEANMGNKITQKDYYSTTKLFSYNDNHTRQILDSHLYLFKYTPIGIINDLYEGIDQLETGQNLLDKLKNMTLEQWLDINHKNDTDEVRELYKPYFQRLKDLLIKSDYNQFTPNVETPETHEKFNNNTFHTVGVNMTVGFINDPRAYEDTILMDYDDAQAINVAEGNKFWIRHGFKGSIKFEKGLRDQYGCTFIAPANSVTSRGSYGIILEMIGNKLLDYNLGNLPTDDPAYKYMKKLPIYDKPTKTNEKIYIVKNKLYVDETVTDKDFIELLGTSDLDSIVRYKIKHSTYTIKDAKTQEDVVLTYNDTNDEIVRGTMYVVQDSEHIAKHAQSLAQRRYADEHGLSYLVRDLRGSIQHGGIISNTFDQVMSQKIGYNWQQGLVESNEDNIIERMEHVTALNMLGAKYFEIIRNDNGAIDIDATVENATLKTSEQYKTLLKNYYTLLKFSEEDGIDRTLALENIDTQLKQKALNALNGDNGLIYGTRYNRHLAARNQLVANTSLQTGTITVPQESWEVLMQHGGTVWANDENVKNIWKNKPQNTLQERIDLYEDLLYNGIHKKDSTGRHNYYLINPEWEYRHGVKRLKSVDKIEIKQKIKRTYAYTLNARSPLQDYGASPITKIVGINMHSNIECAPAMYGIIGGDNDGDTAAFIAVKWKAVENGIFKNLDSRSNSYYDPEYLDRLNKDLYVGTDIEPFKFEHLDLRYAYTGKKTMSNDWGKKENNHYLYVDLINDMQHIKNVYKTLINKNINEYSFTTTTPQECDEYEKLLHNPKKTEEQTKRMKTLAKKIPHEATKVFWVKSHVWLTHGGIDLPIGFPKDFYKTDEYLKYYEKFKDEINMLQAVEYYYNFDKTAQIPYDIMRKNSLWKTLERGRISKINVGFNGGLRKVMYITTSLSVFPTLNSDPTGKLWESYGVKDPSKITVSELITNVYGDPTEILNKDVNSLVPKIENAPDLDLVCDYLKERIIEMKELSSRITEIVNTLFNRENITYEDIKEHITNKEVHPLLYMKVYKQQINNMNDSELQQQVPEDILTFIRMYYFSRFYTEANKKLSDEESYESRYMTQALGQYLYTRGVSKVVNDLMQVPINESKHGNAIANAYKKNKTMQTNATQTTEPYNIKKVWLGNNIEHLRAILMAAEYNPFERKNINVKASVEVSRKRSDNRTEAIPIQTIKEIGTQISLNNAVENIFFNDVCGGLVIEKDFNKFKEHFINLTTIIGAKDFDINNFFATSNEVKTVIKAIKYFEDLGISAYKLSIGIEHSIEKYVEALNINNVHRPKLIKHIQNLYMLCKSDPRELREKYSINVSKEQEYFINYITGKDTPSDEIISMLSSQNEVINSAEFTVRKLGLSKYNTYMDMWTSLAEDQSEKNIVSEVMQDPSYKKTNERFLVENNFERSQSGSNVLNMLIKSIADIKRSLYVKDLLNNKPKHVMSFNNLYSSIIDKRIYGSSIFKKPTKELAEYQYYLQQKNNDLQNKQKELTKAQDKLNAEKIKLQNLQDNYKYNTTNAPDTVINDLQNKVNKDVDELDIINKNIIKQVLIDKLGTQIYNLQPKPVTIKPFGKDNLDNFQEDLINKIDNLQHPFFILVDAFRRKKKNGDSYIDWDAMYKYIKDNYRYMRITEIVPAGEDEGLAKRFYDYVKLEDTDMYKNSKGEYVPWNKLNEREQNKYYKKHNNKYGINSFEDMNKHCKEYIQINGKTYDGFDSDLDINNFITPTLKQIVIKSGNTLEEIYHYLLENNASSIGFTYLNDIMTSVETAYNPYRIIGKGARYITKFNLTQKLIMRMSAGFLLRNAVDTFIQLSTDMYIEKGLNPVIYNPGKIHRYIKYGERIYTVYKLLSEERMFTLKQILYNHENINDCISNNKYNEARKYINELYEYLDAYINQAELVQDKTHRITTRLEYAKNLRSRSIHTINDYTHINNSITKFLLNTTFAEYYLFYDNKEINGKPIRGLRVDANKEDIRKATKRIQNIKEMEDPLFKDLLIEISAFMQTNAQIDMFKQQQYSELYKIVEQNKNHMLNSNIEHDIDYIKQEIETYRKESSNDLSSFLNNTVLKPYEYLTERTENLARILGFIFNRELYGRTYNESIQRSLKSWFNYGQRGPLEMQLTYDIPYISFPIRSISNWIDRLMDPRYVRLMDDIIDGIYSQYADDDGQYSEWEEFMIKSGWIPITKKLGIRAGSGAFDVYNLLTDTKDNLEQRRNPLLKGLIEFIQSGDLKKAASNLATTSAINRAVNTFGIKQGITQKTLGNSSTMFFEYNDDYEKYTPYKYRNNNGRWIYYENIYKDWFNKYGRMRRPTQDPVQLVKNIQWKQYLRYRQNLKK